MRLMPHVDAGEAVAREWEEAEAVMLAESLPGTIFERDQAYASPVERLLDTFEARAAERAEAAAAYRKLAEATSDPVVGFLVQELVADEERRQKLLERMAVTLRDSVNWGHSRSALPTDPAGEVPVPETAMILARAFMRDERVQARNLRNLARDEKDHGDGLFSALLEGMALDSEKHERILHYVVDRLEADRAATA